MNMQESLNKLFALHTFGVKLGLENIQKFLNQIGNPQKKIKKASTWAHTVALLYAK